MSDRRGDRRGLHGEPRRADDDDDDGGHDDGGGEKVTKTLYINKLPIVRPWRLLLVTVDNS